MQYADTDPQNYLKQLPSRGSYSGIGGSGRAERMADVAGGRETFQPDMAPSAESRGAQSDSLAMAHAAAMGQAPSQAEQLGTNMIGQSLQAQLAGAASAKGGAMAQAAALRQAQQGAAAFQQQGTNNLAAMRAQEIATARDQYGQQAAGMRNADLGTAAMYSQNENMQRALNQQGQLGFNAQAIDIDRANAVNQLGTYQTDSQNWQTMYGNASARQRQESDISQHSTDRETGLLGSIIGGGAAAGASIFGSVFKSDERAKQVVPMSDVASMAPGTEDYMHAMGGSAKLDGVGSGDWNAFNTSNADVAKGPVPHGAGGGSMAAAALGKGAEAFMSGLPKDYYSTNGHVQMMVSDEHAKQLMPMNDVDPETGTVQLHDSGMSHGDLLEAGSGLAGAAGMMHGMVGGGGITGGSVNTAGLGSDGTVNPMGRMMSDERAKNSMGDVAMMAAANRALAPKAYEYKPQFTPSDQAPGEVNVGPMAQNMAKNPLSATAVKQAPDGMLMVDKDKALRLALGSIGSLQAQIDHLRGHR